MYLLKTTQLTAGVKELVRFDGEGFLSFMQLNITAADPVSLVREDGNIKNLFKIRRKLKLAAGES